jgi:hypothetical protein
MMCIKFFCKKMGIQLNTNEYILGPPLIPKPLNLEYVAAYTTGPGHAPISSLSPQKWVANNHSSRLVLSACQTVDMIPIPLKLRRELTAEWTAPMASGGAAFSFFCAIRLAE